MKFKLLLLVVLITCVGYSQNYATPKSFAHLKKITVEENWDIYAFLAVNFDASNSDENGDSEEIGFVEIAKDQESKILMKFSNGMSDDPNFVFYKKEFDKLKYLFSIDGQQIFIPGNGFIYVSGIANNVFDKKMKYKFVDDKIQEVNQAFYYVGLQTKTLKEIKLFSDKERLKHLATLPKKSNIEVVASDFTGDDQFYLIKSSFGLLGWWKMDNWNSKEIENLYFRGD